MEVRLSVIVFIFLSSISSTSLGQSSYEEISRIRQTFSRINSDPHLQKIIIEGEDFLEQTPDAGASLAGYFSKNRLVKISEWIGLSYGIRQTDFYYDSNRLVFCFVTERHFKSLDSALDYTQTSVVLEGRYYYQTKVLIQKRVIGTGFWDKSSESELIPESNRYFKLLSEKMNKGIR